MYTLKTVDEFIASVKLSGIPLTDAAWDLALKCVGWPYIFGDRGQECTPSHRRAAFASRGDVHPTIRSKCKNFEGTGSCNGCSFYPGGRTRAFDCRGFTYWVLLKIFGWELKGAGATSQWNNADNWKAKGTVADGVPDDTLVCLFVQKGKTMEHTGFGYHGETCECSNGVQHFKTRNKKWTHWAVPACIDGAVPEASKPVLRKGSKGTYVTLLQTQLMNLGYALPKYGADGSFGAETEAAVKAFQENNGLKADGIVGTSTWDALEKNPVKSKLYTVKIPHLEKSTAEDLVKQYTDAVMTEE